MLIVVGLGQRRHNAGDADAVGAHGDDAGLAVLVQDAQPQRLGVLPPQGEDVPDLDAAGQLQGARAVGGRVALADLGAAEDQLTENAHGDLCRGDGADGRADRRMHGL